MQRKSFPRTQRGLTLIEGCVTLAIVSILAGTAAPSFVESNKKRVLDGSAGELATDFYYARSEAATKQQGVRVSFHAVAAGSCLIVHTGQTADCACDSAGAAQCANGASMLKSSLFPNTRGVTVTANVDSIRFDPIHGMATPTGTVRLATASGLEVRHVVNIMGRIRSCSPGGKIGGYAACH